MINAASNNALVCHLSDIFQMLSHPTKDCSIYLNPFAHVDMAQLLWAVPSVMLLNLLSSHTPQPQSLILFKNFLIKGLLRILSSTTLVEVIFFNPSCMLKVVYISRQMEWQNALKYGIARPTKFRGLSLYI